MHHRAPPDVISGEIGAICLAARRDLANMREWPGDDQGNDQAHDRQRQDVGALGLRQRPAAAQPASRHDEQRDQDRRCEEKPWAAPACDPQHRQCTKLPSACPTNGPKLTTGSQPAAGAIGPKDQNAWQDEDGL